MSCMIASKEKVSKTASFIAALLNHGFNGFGFYADEETMRAFKDCKTSWGYCESKIYNALYELNFLAYNTRYKVEGSPDDIPANPLLYFWKEIDRKIEVINGNSQEVVQEWHYEALQALNFIRYQLEEDVTAGNEKTKALHRLALMLAMFIATHTVTYHKCDTCWSM